MNSSAPAAVLPREMSGWDGLFVTLAGLSPSIGVFVVGSDVLRQAGSGAVWCFAAAVLLGIAMASVYAELGSALPSAGGEYSIASLLLGADAGFAMLALNLLGLCLATSLCSLGMVAYLQAVWPVLPLRATAMAIVAAVTGLAVLKVRVNALFAATLLACELASLAATAWLGVVHAQPGALARLLHPMSPAPDGTLRHASLAVLGLGAAGGIYAFNGYGGVIFFGEEIRDARRTLAPIVYATLLIAAIAELLPMLAVVVGAPDLARLCRSDAPIAGFIRTLGGPVMARVTSLAVAAAILNTIVAVMLTAGRQLYASARDGAWGGASPGGGALLARVHPRYGSPHVATLAMGAAALLCCLLPQRVLVAVLGNGNIATYATLSLAVMRGRRLGLLRGSSAPAPLFPAGPLLVLGALAALVAADLLTPATGLPGLAATAATLLVGVAAHRSLVRRGTRWRIRDPN